VTLGNITKAVRVRQRITDINFNYVDSPMGIQYDGILLILLGINLDSSARDEEPLVNAAIDRSRGKVLAPGDGGELAGVSTISGVLDVDVGTITNH
jgi:hypothetical protein